MYGSIVSADRLNEVIVRARVLQQVRHMYSCTINTLWIQLCVVISIHSSYGLYIHVERRTVNVSRIEIETVIRYFRCNCEQSTWAQYTQCNVCVRRSLPSTLSNVLSLFAIRLEVTHNTPNFLLNCDSLAHSLPRICSLFRIVVLLF